MTYSSQEQQVIDYIVNKAKNLINPQSIYLFGSRAQGKAHENSDYDFAFQLEKEPRSQWARFALEAKEEAPTLLPLDLVNLNEISETFKEKILQTGHLIFTRGQNEAAGR